MVKNQSILQIQYTLLTEESSYNYSSFLFNALYLIRTLPKDVYQLIDSLRFYDYSLKFHLKKGIELFSVPPFINYDLPKENAQDFIEYSNWFNNSLVKVFIVDGNLSSHDNLLAFFKNIDFCYFTIINPNESSLKNYSTSVNYFQNSNDLTRLLIQDKSRIERVIQPNYPDIFLPTKWEVNPRKLLFNKNPFIYSNYTESNYFILNQIIGNHWVEGNEKIISKTFPDNQLKPKDRIGEIINQIHSIDEIIFSLYDEGILKQVNPQNSVFSTLILIAPYHFPRLKKILKGSLSSREKKHLSLYQSEQSTDYTFEINADNVKYLKKEEIQNIMLSRHKQLQFLDKLGYLHGSLSNSPILRLPIISESINTQLSHLRHGFSSNKKKSRKIEKIGKILADKLLHEKVKILLERRAGQIMVISDLPVEWMSLGGYPLCFTHDICRIPEKNQNTVVNNFILNHRLNYYVSDNIIEKTLVIHCASKSDLIMEKAFNLIDSFKADYKFHSVRCSSVKEISEAVKKYRPELLVFDCHGGFDEETLSSYLIIDSEKNIRLAGEEIINHDITAPLVFLSSCNTMPNYGYVKYLSDAFMAVNAYVVTASFLPLKIKDAAILILRLLGNLFYLKGKTIHSNWLEFISHLLRTAQIHEAVRIQTAKYPEIEIENAKIGEITASSMFFEKRKNSLVELKNLINENFPEANLDLEILTNDWIHYTTIGRADLIYFQNWVAEHRVLNLDEYEEERET